MSLIPFIGTDRRYRRKRTARLARQAVHASRRRPSARKRLLFTGLSSHGCAFRIFDGNFKQMRHNFINAIRSNEAAFGVGLSEEAVDQLARYHEMVLEHNPLLHLAAPMPDEEFAIRHVLESLAMLRHLPEGAKFVDVGAGAGLPSVPCLIARGDLMATLIESKVKKARFLETAVGRLGLAARAKVVNRQFEEADPGDGGFVACRALDRFTERLPRLLKWAGRRRLLLFGGPALAEALKLAGRRYDEELLPLSERRYLYSVDV